MRNRDASAVSHWIRTGKLTSPALVGEGRLAKIDVALADVQLAAVLDLGQQLAQPAPLMAPAPARLPSPVAEVPANGDNARRLAAKAEREEIETAQARLKLERESGQWIPVDAARRAAGERLTEALNAFEGYIREQARIFAEQTQGDPRAIEQRMLGDFREWRMKMAKAARERAAAHRNVAPVDDAEDDEEAV